MALGWLVLIVHLAESRIPWAHLWVIVLTVLRWEHLPPEDPELREMEEER